MPALHTDGLVGLSPRIHDSTDGKPSRDSIMQKLYENNTIPKPIFSIYLNDQVNQSKMIFGGYNE